MIPLRNNDSGCTSCTKSVMKKPRKGTAAKATPKPSMPLAIERTAKPTAMITVSFMTVSPSARITLSRLLSPFPYLLSVSGRRDEQHRGRRMTRDTMADAAQENLANKASSLTAHYDKFHPALASYVDDFSER